MCGFEGYEPFPQLGLSLNVLEPGQPKGLYHAENAQEGFLVIAGECLLIVESTERRMKQWDYFHCPAWTEHVLIGVGDGPCVMLAVGSRAEPLDVMSPVNEVALLHGAGAHQELHGPAWELLGFRDGAYRGQLSSA